jgi:hypothetical protein
MKYGEYLLSCLLKKYDKEFNELEYDIQSMRLRYFILILKRVFFVLIRLVSMNLC